MSGFQITALVLTLAAAFAYVNHRWLKLPRAIGLMAISLLFSLAMVAIGKAAPSLAHDAAVILKQIDFDDTLMQGMLGFLLFAGALHVNLGDLAESRVPIAVLATLGVAVSTALVGGMIYGVSEMLGLGMRPIYCLLFGALISPTDPIAVLSILKTAGAPKRLETTIAGESLFNDGVGVVFFIGLLELAAEPASPDVAHLLGLFLKEAVGGALFGLAIGVLAYKAIASIDQYQVEVLVSLATVAGGYALASAIHVSGPIAMVVAGLILGNQGRLLAMSDVTREHLDMFWELIDEILNAVLFVLMGMELLVISFGTTHLVAAVMAVPLVLLARFLSVGVPVRLMRKRLDLRPGTIRTLTWGGLRGGISIALALSIPAQINGELVHERDAILAITYVVVVFAILVQGLSLQPLLKRWLAESAAG